MDEKRREEYYALFERFIDSMSAIPDFDRGDIVNIVTEICEFFHLSKAETQFYQSVAHEARGEGEIISDFDNGKSDRIAVQRRLISRTGAVVISTVYQSNDENLTDEEAEKVDILLRTMMTFIGRNRLQNAVEKLGFYDEAGYANIRSFMRFLDSLAGNNRLAGHTAACYNLRRFTMINQQYGKELGDVVMHKFYNLMRNIVGEDGIVARMGGDNFVTIFPTERTDAVLDVFSGVPIVVDQDSGKRVLVSASAGLYAIPEDFPSDDPRVVMDRIFPTMHIAKQETNGTIVWYNDKMVEMRDHAMKVRSVFPKALKAGEFHVFYQPKVDVTWGKMVGAEALCRWFHDGKIVPPMEFIPVLEQNADICYLDYHILDLVCRDLRRWIDEGKKVVRVSVNFSRKNLVEMDLLSNILDIVDRYRIPHKYIEIELTETTTDVAFTDLRRVVTGLRDAGIACAVDDFGMGYSSLTLLQDIPWTVLKIDKSFLPADDEQVVSNNHMMYKHVVSMAREIGLECVTEGVETKKQVMILRKNHCHTAQGFFFDKPMPVEDFESRMESPLYDLSHTSQEWRFHSDEKTAKKKRV